MPAAIYAARPFTDIRSHPFRTVALVLLFWVTAALMVLIAHELDVFTTSGAVAVKAIAIVGAAFLYMRFAARGATVDHAMLVGISWLMLDIGAEMIATSSAGQGWFVLIGSPAQSTLRDVLLVTWVGAPALFAYAE